MSVPGEHMAGMLDAVDAGLQEAAGNEPEQAELDEVSKLNREYDSAREFDKFARQQYNKDRRYAQGIADMTWASDANIIGAFIDILVSFLFAQNPDVSVRPARRVPPPADAVVPPPQKGQIDATRFAETLEIVISRLWKVGKLKRTMRKMVRSALSVGIGWMKVIQFSESRRNPQVEKQIKDVQDNIAQIEAVKAMMGTEYDGSSEDKLTEYNRLMQGLEAKLEVIVKRGLAIDFCRAEDVQVSLDVADIMDYADADWVANEMFVRKDQIKARFPRLTDEDCKSAVQYYQRQTSPNALADGGAASQMDRVDASAEGQYIKGTAGVPTGALLGGSDPVSFVKIIEIWDQKQTLIKTVVDGVKRWPVEPYSPPQASTHFYPFFALAFYETDGARHPQSLSWRMKKLQDEYSSKRSNGRLTAERSVPGTIFNRGQLDPDDAKKIENSTHMEMVGIQPTNQDMPLDKVIIGKPVPRVDPLIFDTSSCQRDMEVMSGVQEAKTSSSSGGSKTATEAEIEESGFASRTGADRDSEEDMLTELAQYTAETAIQALKPDFVMRLAGPYAFWPFGMDVQDVLTMLDVEIKAGTTGKPQARADKETWATLLPLVQNMMGLIQQLELTNPPMAQAYRNLLQETIKRLDDRLDISSILPPMMPPNPGAALPIPPGGDPAGGGELPQGNGTVNNPATLPTPAPEVTA